LLAAHGGSRSITVRAAAQLVQKISRNYEPRRSAMYLIAQI
jgi:hypothetical protein